MIEVKLRRGESVDKALRKLKKKMNKEGVLKMVRQREYYEKPSARKYRERKKAKFWAKVEAKRNLLTKV